MDKLDDLNHSVILLPFHDVDENNAPAPSLHVDDSHIPRFESEGFSDDELDINLLRWQAYCSAWNKCLAHIRSILRAMHSPFINEIVQHVFSAYKDTLPGLPSVELPVLAVTGDDTVLNDLVSMMKSFDKSATPDIPTIYLSGLHVSECTSVQSCMAAIVKSFLSNSPDWRKGQRQQATQYADYDIQLLHEWYSSVDHLQPPILVVLLHEFERLDPPIIQDVFHIFSLSAPRLPVVFLLALSTPESATSYLCSTFSRSTLSLLRVHSFIAPSCVQVLEELVTRTFFSPSFQPDVYIGPSTIDFLMEISNRSNLSISLVLSILQLTYLKHFSVNPLTLLVSSDLDGSSPFVILDAVLLSLHSKRTTSTSQRWNAENQQSLSTAVEAARTEFRLRAMKMQLGFHMLKLIDGFCRSQGSEDMGWDCGGGTFKLIALMLRGKSDKIIFKAISLIKQLSLAKQNALFDALNNCFRDLERHVREEEEVAWAQFFKYYGQNVADETREESISNWLGEYLRILTRPLGTAPLCEIWYVGMTPFPAELFSPSIRASITSALLRPHYFTGESQEEPALWELPDPSIIFQRYLDSGKMVNVYDWFESFQVVLETQRQGVEDKQQGDDKWEMQLQARFMRAIHELELLGLTKPTKRKADHILRTLFDVPDDVLE